MGLRFYAGSPIRVPPPAPASNAPPVNSVPSGQTTYIDTIKHFTVAGNNAVTVADTDTPLVTATLTTSTGMLEVMVNSSVIISNNKSNKIIVVGSPASINRALDGMRWTPPTSFSGVATITLRINDGENIDIDSFDITVSGTAPVYIPPGPTNTVPTLTKLTPYLTNVNFSADNIRVYDPDVASLTTTLTTVGGTVNVSIAGGGTITGNNTGLMTLVGTQPQINAALGTLVYKPNSGFWGYGKLTISTTDGPLTDTDDIVIVVRAQELPPVQRMPPNSYYVANDQGPACFVFWEVDDRIQITTAYKAPITTTLSDTYGSMQYMTAMGTGPTLQPDNLPAKVVYCYWDASGTLPIKSVSIDYTCIGIVRMNHMSNGAMGWPHAIGSLAPHDLQQVRARGQRCFLVIGGPGTRGFNYTTREQSDNLLNSIKPYIYYLNGVDGVDFQNYDGDLTGLELTTEAVYIAQQLKATYGAGFNIVYTFRQNPASQQVKDIAKALHNANCLTFCQQIFMENAAFKAQYAVSNKVLQFITDTQIPASKVVIGLSTYYDYATSLTLAECTREWGQVVAAQPTIRGVNAWSANTDVVVNWAFINQFKVTIGANPLSKGKSTITRGTGGKVLTFVGDVTTINNALNEIYLYSPYINMTYNDTLVVTTTDGVMSDTRTIPLVLSSLGPGGEGGGGA